MRNQSQQSNKKQQVQRNFLRGLMIRIDFQSRDKIRKAKYLFGMYRKLSPFLQLATEKKTPFLEHPKQIFGPSYFLSALDSVYILPRLLSLDRFYEIIPIA